MVTQTQKKPTGETSMGCATSACAKNKKKNIPECVIFVPSLRVPVHSDLRRQLKGILPKFILERLKCLRNRILLIAEDTGGSAISEIQRALEEYLSLLAGLIKKNNCLQGSVEFKWKALEDGRQETCLTNIWMEVLSVIHMKAVLALSDSNSMLIPKDCSGSGIRVVSTECKRNAVDLLLKASGYLEFCLQEVLVHIPSDIKKKLPDYLQESAIQALSIQALGVGTQIQLGLAVESQNATLSVKRRLACELVIYFTQAYLCMSCFEVDHGCTKKLLRFIYWKFLEAKAAAYYYHGLVTDKGNEPACHVNAVSCFLAAAEILTETKKASLSFCLAPPVTRTPPQWGVMKHLHQKIPEVASRKSQMYGYLLEEEKALHAPPELPDFQLSLRPDQYELPEIDEVWKSGDFSSNEISMLKHHLRDSDEDDDDNCRI